MNNYVKLYGNQSNPYPYIEGANLFYLGSYHEAAPMVYAEAMILKTPILTTKTCSAEELVGQYEIICDNNEESMLNAFRKIFENNSILEKDKQIDFNTSNKEIVNKFLRWVNND